MTWMLDLHAFVFITAILIFWVWEEVKDAD